MRGETPVALTAKYLKLFGAGGLVMSLYEYGIFNYLFNKRSLFNILISFFVLYILA